MACHVKDNKIDSVIKLISEQGFDGLGEAVTLLINQAMDIERSHHLQATPYERTEARNGYANGYISISSTQKNKFIGQVNSKGIVNATDFLSSLDSQTPQPETTPKHSDSPEICKEFQF